MTPCPSLRTHKRLTKATRGTERILVFITNSSSKKEEKEVTSNDNIGFSLELYANSAVGHIFIFCLWQSRNISSITPMTEQFWKTFKNCILQMWAMKVPPDGKYTKREERFEEKTFYGPYVNSMKQSVTYSSSFFFVKFWLFPSICDEALPNSMFILLCNLESHILKREKCI